MRRITSHAKSGLFLTEMIMCLLFLGLSCAICLRLFSAAYLLREEARTNNHIQELLITTSEILEGWDGDPDSFLRQLSTADLSITKAFSESDLTENDPEKHTAFKGSFEASFSRKWVPSSQEKAYYLMKAVLEQAELENTLELSFYRVGKEKEKDLPFFQSSVSFPSFS